MEELQPLLDPPHHMEQDSVFWERLRHRLLFLFWICLAVMIGMAVFLLVKAYQPPPSSLWYQQRVLCSYTELQATNQSALSHRMTEASRLGCGGIIVRLQEVGDNVRSLVVEGQRSGLHLVLDIEVSEEYNSSQVQTMKEALHSWIQDGVSGFSLSGGQRSSLRMVSQFLQEDMDIVAREDRFILLPDWLCEETASNKSVLLCTCSLPRWDSAKVTECSQVQNTAWQVSSGSSLELRQFMAATLPGTAILPLSQTQPPPSWLELLLFRRHQHPALYAGWLQPMADNSTYGIVHRWGCSTLLVAINPTNQPRNLSVRLTGYKATAQLLLSTTWRRSRDLNVQEGLLLAPGEAQLLRLTLEEL